MNQGQEEEAQSTLIAMGFPADQARSALRECGGNVEHAANLLLSGGGSSSNANANASALSSSNSSYYTTGTTTPTMIHGTLHQYNVDNGKSSCTCIALAAAQLFLQEQQLGNAALSTFLNTTFLQNAVLQGVETYNTIVQTTALIEADKTMEHLSAEDVLQTGKFPSLRLLDNGVVQGILSPLGGPLSLHVLLAASQSTSQWTAVLIIKPPETVLCCLPPTTTSTTTEHPQVGNDKESSSPSSLSQQSMPYILIDSHPRPQQFDAAGSYIRQHATLAALIQSLQELFPATELGSDIPGWMSAMYNSFDLYRLTLKQ